MGHGASHGCPNGLRDQNRVIEQQIHREAEEEKKKIKLLLLGTGECGKSTVLKQMRIIHNEKFSESEFELQKATIQKFVLQSIIKITEAMKQMGIFYSNLEREKDIVIIAKGLLEQTNGPVIDEALAQAVERVWTDHGVQACFQRSCEFHMSDSTQYFLDESHRILQSDYRPIVQDMLRTHCPTTGVVEVRFQAKGKVFRVFDVGGQRSERKKWIHCFDNVDAIIYIAALSDYNLKLREDGRTLLLNVNEPTDIIGSCRLLDPCFDTCLKIGCTAENRLMESMNLFASIVNSMFFAKTNIVLFFNKKDIFEQKIQSVPITFLFKAYTGITPNIVQGPGPAATIYTGSGTFDECSDFIELQFRLQNKTSTREIYAHKTCGTDTTQVGFVIGACIDIIIDANLKRSGMF